MDFFTLTQGDPGHWLTAHRRFLACCDLMEDKPAVSHPDACVFACDLIVAAHKLDLIGGGCPYGYGLIGDGVSVTFAGTLYAHNQSVLDPRARFCRLRQDLLAGPLTQSRNLGGHTAVSVTGKEEFASDKSHDCPQTGKQDIQRQVVIAAADRGRDRYGLWNLLALQPLALARWCDAFGN